MKVGGNLVGKERFQVEKRWRYDKVIRDTKFIAYRYESVKKFNLRTLQRPIW